MPNIYNKFITVLFVAIILNLPLTNAQGINYKAITAKKSGPANPLSPDPLVNYSWPGPKADDDLQTYQLRPVSFKIDNKASFDMSRFKKDNVIALNGTGNIRFDFGQTNAGWLEFESDDLADSVTLSISEYNEPAIVNNGAVHRLKLWRRLNMDTLIDWS
jgi:alpha-L-rhamnosidase